MRLHFGDCVLDLESRELVRRGGAVHLLPKAFRVLEVLAEARPRALSKAELRTLVWPDVVVSEATLSSLIARLRTALGGTARDQRFVRTLHGFGYAFCAEAREEASRPRRSRSRAGLAHRLYWGTRRIALEEGDNVLGRDPDATVVIDSTTVSRRHARIVVAGDEATLEDLGSKNGTELRGKRLTSPARLADGDPIRVGPALLTFRVVPAGRSTETEAP